MRSGSNLQFKSPSGLAPAPLVRAILQRKCACGNHANRGECGECTQKKSLLQRKTPHSALAVQDSESVPPIVHEVLRLPGQPLDTATRAFFEPRFGHDFSRVRPYTPNMSRLTIAPSGTAFEHEADRVADRVLRALSPRRRVSGQPQGANLSGIRLHTDSKAAESAIAVNALAYTVGHDIVFAPGQYNPVTEAGRRLLAHEVTHVGQQPLQPGALQRQKPEERMLAGLERCEGKTDVTERFSDFIRDVPALVASASNLTDEQRKGLTSMMTLVLSPEDSVDLTKYNVVCCTKINSELGLAGEFFGAYVSAHDRQLGLSVGTFKLMDEYRLTKDKEALTKFLQTIAHEKRHVTLGRSMKVEPSALKPGRMLSAAENAEYRAEEILTTAEEIAVGRMALGKEYEVPVSEQEKLHRLRNMIRSWVTEEEYQRLRNLIIKKLRDRYGFGDGCDTSLTLGVLTSMEKNRWHECNPTTGELYTKIPEGLNVCQTPGHRVCHPKP